MNNLVSVIIPNYNSKKYIHDTIQSVLNQTYKNIEILIIDDCSSDNSVSIIKNMASENKNIKDFIIKTNCRCTYECALSFNILGNWRYQHKLLSSLISRY